MHEIYRMPYMAEGPGISHERMVRRVQHSNMRNVMLCRVLHIHGQALLAFSLLILQKIKSKNSGILYIYNINEIHHFRQ